MGFPNGVTKRRQKDVHSRLNLTENSKRKRTKSVPEGDLGALFSHRERNTKFVFVKDVSNSKEARAAFVLLSEKAVNSDIFIEKNRENA